MAGGQSGKRKPMTPTGATTAGFPGGLALAAMGGRSGTYLAAYRAGHEQAQTDSGFDRYPTGAFYSDELTAAGIRSDEDAAAIDRHQQHHWGRRDWYSQVDWHDVEEGFRDGWFAAKAEPG